MVTYHHLCTNVYAVLPGTAHETLAAATTLVHAGLVVRPFVTRKLSVTATASSSTRSEDSQVTDLERC